MTMLLLMLSFAGSIAIIGVGVMSTSPVVALLIPSSSIVD